VGEVWLNYSYSYFDFGDVLAAKLPSATLLYYLI